MEFLRAAIVTLQYRMGLQEDLHLIVMRDLNERTAHTVHQESENGERMSGERLHCRDNIGVEAKRNNLELGMLLCDYNCALGPIWPAPSG